jgi:6-pyruvoyltetrahydropterin/6-carboxytetrahydropterin synthase
MYLVIKRYGHEEGWSCTFRQHRADHSHCRFIHGYPLAIEITFACDYLDARNWCMDFGGLKELKGWLQATFDHKMLVAEDDPQLEFFRMMAQGPAAIADIVIVPDVGCEKFAELIYYETARILEAVGETPRVWVRSVRVSEHGGNSAVYLP